MRNLLLIITMLSILMLGCDEQIDQELATINSTHDKHMMLIPLQSYENTSRFAGELAKNTVERPLKLRSSGTITIEPCKGRGQGQGQGQEQHDDGQHDDGHSHDSGEGTDDGQHHDSGEATDDGQQHEPGKGQCKGQNHEPGEGNHGGHYHVLVEGTGNGTHLGLFSVEITYCSDGVNPLTDILGVQTAANGDQLFMILVGAGEEPGQGAYQDYQYYDGTGRFENATGYIRMYGFVDPVNQVWELAGEGRISY